MLKPWHKRTRQWLAVLLVLITLGLSAGCSPEVSVSEPSDDFPQMRTYTLEKSALPTADPGFENVKLWASIVRNSRHRLHEETVALMFALRAPAHQIEANDQATLTIDGAAHPLGEPFYDAGMRYDDGIRETLGLDLPFPLFYSLAYADTASLTLGNRTIPLPNSKRKGLRTLTQQLQNSTR